MACAIVANNTLLTRQLQSLRNLFTTLRYIPDNASGPSMFNYAEAVREILTTEQDFLTAMEMLLHVSLGGWSAFAPQLNGAICVGVPRGVGGHLPR